MAASLSFSADQLLAGLRRRVEGEASPGRWLIALAEHDRALAETTAGEHDLEALLGRARDNADDGTARLTVAVIASQAAELATEEGRDVASATDVAAVVVSAAASTPDERPKPIQPAAVEPPRSATPARPGKATRSLDVAHRTVDYDLFVSYKSDDVMVARPVVDGLIASGARVWFAEYEILLAERERFQERIDEGIRRSARGLVFTNNRYVDSEYCRLEIDQLLEFVGPENMLEVPVPVEDAPHRAYPALDVSDQIHFVNTDTLVPAVCDWLGLPHLDRPRPRRRAYRDQAGRHAGWKGKPSTYQGTLLGRPWRVSLEGGWTVEKDPANDPRFAGMLPEFKFATRNPVLFANISAGVDVSPESQRLDEIEGDRGVYEYLLDYAPRHLGAVGAEAKGVHLLFSSRGRSQMGLTYWSEDPDGPPLWTRKVSIIVANPSGSATAEFVFTFGLLGGAAQWRDCCLMTPLMDDLAVSLTWE